MIHDMSLEGVTSGEPIFDWTTNVLRWATIYRNQSDNTDGITNLLEYINTNHPPIKLYNENFSMIQISVHDAAVFIGIVTPITLVEVNLTTKIHNNLTEFKWTSGIILENITDTTVDVCFLHNPDNIGIRTWMVRIYLLFLYICKFEAIKINLCPNPETLHTKGYPIYSETWDRMNYSLAFAQLTANTDVFDQSYTGIYPNIINIIKNYLDIIGEIVDLIRVSGEISSIPNADEYDIVHGFIQDPPVVSGMLNYGNGYTCLVYFKDDTPPPVPDSSTTPDTLPAYSQNASLWKLLVMYVTRYNIHLTVAPDIVATEIVDGGTFEDSNSLSSGFVEIPSTNKVFNWSDWSFNWVMSVVYSSRFLFNLSGSFANSCNLLTMSRIFVTMVFVTLKCGVVGWSLSKVSTIRVSRSTKNASDGRVLMGVGISSGFFNWDTLVPLYLSTICDN